MTTTNGRTSTRRSKKGSKMMEGFSRTMGNVESMVDEVSQRLWDITR